MSEVQKIALEIAIRKNAFIGSEDHKTQQILEAFEDAKLFLFLTSDAVQNPE